MTEPTDDDVEQIAAEIQVIACEYGHVHFQIVEIGGKEDCGLHTVFSPVEARSLARTILQAAHEADMATKNLPGIVGGDAGPCSIH